MNYVIMGSGLVNMESTDRLEMRRPPITAWLQLANIATLAVVSLLVFKMYKAVVRFIVWITSPAPNCEDIRTILFLGPKTDLNLTLLHELSIKFDTPVTQSQLKEDATTTWRGRKVLLYGGDWTTLSKDEVFDLQKRVDTIYGPIDLLVISSDRQHQTPPDFLTELNQQLLTQFWILMAFLPGMLIRDKGTILSVALEKTSSLANAGVMRTVYEDVAQKGSQVVLTLVERNNVLERVLPALPPTVLARLSMDGIGRREVLVIPSAIDYLSMPLLLGSMYLKPFFDFLWSPRRSPRRLRQND